MSGPSVRGTPIVCLGFAEWDAELWTNQHHLIARLSKSSPTLFIESLGLRQPTVSKRDLERILRRLRRGLRPLRRENGVHVLSPLVVPYYRLGLVRELNGFLLRRAVTRTMATIGFARPILWAYVPHALALVDVLRPRLVIYHCVDDIAAHERVDRDSFRRLEEAFVRAADLVIASSRPLWERLSLHASNVRLMTNVADTEAFAAALEAGPCDPALASLPRPRIVFVGAVSSVKVDIGLLRELARLRPDWSLVLVGPVGLGDPRTDVSSLRSEPNVHLLGARPHEMLPAVLRAADAAIIPYRLNDLTSSVFPMKVYEFLAAGLPVVSTPLPSLRDVEGVVFARTAPEMVARLEQLLAEDSPERRRARSELASRHSWSARIEEIEAEVAQLSWRP